MKYFKYASIYALKLFIYAISFFIPKNKNIWIFGSWGGTNYADNTRFIYEYVNIHDKSIKAVWICKDDNIISHLNNMGYKAYGYYSLKGIITAMRAKLCFITEGHHDVNAFCCARAKFINTWHGIPMKKILYDNELEPHAEKWKKFLLEHILKFDHFSMKTDYLLATSEVFIDIYESAFKIPKKNIFLCGYPRNDVFFDAKPSKYVYEWIQRAHGRLIAYLPTHRIYGKENAYNIMKNLDYINKKLNELSIFMIYKPHFHELKNLPNNIKDYTNIIIPSDYDSVYNVNTFLPFCDLLVTDYSGAYFDYLLADKPIVFFNYDMEWYLNNDRKLYFDYDKITAGPKCSTWDEVFYQVNKMLEHDNMYEERLKIKNYIFSYPDGHSSKRLYENAIRIVNGIFNM